MEGGHKTNTRLSGDSRVSEKSRDGGLVRLVAVSVAVGLVGLDGFVDGIAEHVEPG